MATEADGVSKDRRLFSVYPSELTFQPEPGRESICEIKVMNTTKHHVAFKVKTTAPKKYLVRPNKGVVQPWDSQIITITHQGLNFYAEDAGTKDKFLVQSTIVPPATDFDDLPQNTFDDDGARKIEELKLGVVYKAADERSEREDEPNQMNGHFRRSSDSLIVRLEHRLKEELAAALRQNQQLKRELDALRRSRKKNGGFSMQFAIFVGFISMILGLILNLLTT